MTILMHVVPQITKSLLGQLAIVIPDRFEFCKSNSCIKIEHEFLKMQKRDSFYWIYIGEEAAIKIEVGNVESFYFEARRK